MSSSDNSRYKPWKLFKRYSNIQLPKPVVDLDLLKTYKDDHDDSGIDTTHMVSLSCSFAPDDACTIVCQSTFTGNIHRINAIGELASSFVSIWEVDEDGAEDNGCMFSYSPVPYPTFSKCGNICCTIMNGSNGELQVIGYDLENDGKYFYDIPLKCVGGAGSLCGRTKCLVMDYDRAVTLTNLRMENLLYDCVLTLWKICNNLKLIHIWTKGLKNIIPIEKLTHTSLQQCTFSPCSNFIAIMLCNGQFFLIDVQQQRCVIEMNFLKLVLPDEHNKLPTYKFPIVFCFNPNFSYEIVTVGYLDRFYFIDVTRSYDGAESLKQISLPDVEDCVKDVCYSKNGCFLAVCSHFGHVRIYSSKQNYALLYLLSIPGDFTTIESVQAYYASFSSSSEELVIAHSKAVVSVWQLPRIINLKEICRLKIRTLLCKNSIDLLEIPVVLKQYLSFKPGLG